jgi:hypothetical protein
VQRTPFLRRQGEVPCCIVNGPWRKPLPAIAPRNSTLKGKVPKSKTRVSSTMQPCDSAPRDPACQSSGTSRIHLFVGLDARLFAMAIRRRS